MDRIIEILTERSRLDLNNLQRAAVENGINNRRLQLGFDTIEAYTEYFDQNVIEDIPLYFSIFLQANEEVVQHSIIEQAFHQVPAMVIAIDSNRKISAISEYFQKRIGYDRQELIGASIEDFITDESSAKSELLFTLSSQTAYNLPITLIKKNETYIDTLVSVASFDGKKNGHFSIVIAQDVSDLRKTEDILKATNYFSQQIRNTIPSILFIYDIDTGKTRYLNDRIYEILDLDKDNVNDSELLEKYGHPDDLVNFKKQYENLLEQKDTQHTIQYKIRIKNRVGNYLWFQIRERIFKFDDFGEPLQSIGTATDITSEVEKEERLKRSEEHTRIILNNTQYTFYLIDPDYKLLAFNRKAEADAKFIFGLELHEGFDCRKLLNNDSLPLFSSSFHKALNGERVEVKYETDIVQNYTRWFQIIYGPARNKNDEIIGVTFSSTDITEHHLAQVALENSEQRYDNALDAINAGVWEHNIATGNSVGSKKFYELLGFEDYEIPQKTDDFAHEFVHPEDQVFRKKAFAYAVENPPGRYQIEYRIRTKKEGYKWFHINGKVIYNNITGEPVKLIGSIIDIDSQRKTEKELKDREQLLQSINQNISEAIYRSTEDGTLIYANGAFLKMTGYTEYDVKHRYISAHDFYCNQEERKLLVKELTRNGNIVNREVLLKRKDGSTFWGLLSTMTVVSSDGEVYFDGAIRNVTHMRKMNDELQSAKTQAEEMNRLKTSFLANMSHEVRTPINGVLGLADLIDHSDSIEEIKELSKLIKESGTRLLNTITSILDLSRLEAKAGDFSAKKINLNNYIDQVKNIYQVLAKQSNIDIQFDLAYEPLFILSEESMLDQVLNNLIGNAIKFTPKGMVTVSTRCIVKDGKRPFAELIISDTGVGIAPQFIDKIFEPFEQESYGTKRKFEGSGLGLSICKKYIELLGGKITVKSEQGKGSSFTILVPLYQD